MIDAIATVMEAMDIDIGKGVNACVKRDGDGDGHCYRIQAVMHVIDVMAIVMDIVIEVKL